MGIDAVYIIVNKCYKGGIGGFASSSPNGGHTPI